MKALVTGAAGFVGTHLAGALLSHGHSVRAMILPSEDSAPLAEAGAEVVRGDVREAADVGRAVDGIETVFHLAAIHGLWQPRQAYLDVNVGGTENVCRAVLSAGVAKLVYVSSWTVYGMDLGRTVDESFPFKPIADTYTETKAAADTLVQQHIKADGLPAVIVRPGTMFGPGDHVNFGRMAVRLKAGTAVIFGSGRNAVPFVFVGDVVDGMILAAQSPRSVGQAYNLSTDQPVTQEQLWAAVARETGAKPPRLRIPYRAAYLLASVAEKAVRPDSPGRQPLVTRLGVQLFGADNRHAIGKARAELGYAPQVPVLEGIRLAGEWFRDRDAAKPERVD